MNCRGICVGLLVSGLLVSGCAPKDSDLTDVPPSITTESVLADLEATLTAASLDAALEQGLAAMADLPGEMVDPQVILAWMAGKVGESRDAEILRGFIRNVVAMDENAGVAAIRMLETTAREIAEPADWTEFLQSDEMPVFVQAYGVQSWLTLFGMEAEVDAVSAKLDRILQDDFAEYINQILPFALSQALEHGDQQRFWLLYDKSIPRVPENAAVWGQLHILKGRAFVRDSLFAEAFAHYRKYSEALGDARLAGEYYRLMMAADEAGQSALIDEMRAYGYAAMEFPVLRNRVARWDMQKLKNEQDIPTLVNGVRAIMGHGIPLNVVIPTFFGQLFYPVLSGADASGLLALRDLVKDMDAAAGEEVESLRSSVTTALLDIYFYQKDFRSALERVNSGVPGYDEAWHAELHDKVQAHLAEAEGRGADAVMFYQKHIDRVRAWTEAIRSPESGRLISPNDVIGLNERRIGDIWMREGETVKASAAYDRAVEAYRAALEDYADDPESQAEMRKILEEIEVTEK